jgi:CO/xanthine dehydrogenase FAD-binding subunit
MDLNTVKQVLDAGRFLGPSTESNGLAWQSGFAWLGGGTWLFSEPQPGTDTLVDMGRLGWPAIVQKSDGLEIAATCTIAELDAFHAPPEWKAAPLLRQCCRSLLASFKIWNAATVGGNICMSLPAGAMISLTTALEGVYTLWPRNGPPRDVPAIDFVTGEHANVLAAGELLRSIFLPVTALRKTFAFRRCSLTKLGRSAVLLVGTRGPRPEGFLLTITAATVRPVQVRFPAVPQTNELRGAIDKAVPDALYLDDPHGSPAYRRHMTYYFAEQIRSELANQEMQSAE